MFEIAGGIVLAVVALIVIWVVVKILANLHNM